MEYLWDVYPDVKLDMKDYCSHEYRKWEQEVCKLWLESLGYTDVSFGMGEYDSFGPLSRVIFTTDSNGNQRKLWYG